MEFRFKENDLDSILSNLKAELDGREIGKILDFSNTDSALKITIKKLGTSTLDFDVENGEGGLVIALKKEKISLAHRPLKKEIIQKLEKIVEKIGGSMH